MNGFQDVVRGINVVLIAVIALAVAVVSAISLLVVADVVAPDTVGPSGWIREQFAELDGLGGTDRTIAIVVAAALLGFSLLLLVFESIPALVASSTYTADAGGQTVVIDRDTVRQMVERTARETEDVTSAHADLREAKDGLTVNLKAGVSPDANIAQTSRRLESRIKDDLREMAGVSVGTVRMELAYRPESEPKTRSEREPEHPRTA